MVDDDGDVSDLTWACIHGHVFSAPLPPAGAIVRCPEASADGACLTSFVYEPFDTEQEAYAAATGNASPRPNFAPWAGPRRPVCDRLAYWADGS